MGLVKLNDRGVRNATTYGSLNTGSMTFIKKLTASDGDATLSFVDGASSVVLDDTYKEYLFTFNNIHPENDARYFVFQGSIDTGSNYNVTVTNTVFQAYADEADTSAAIAYEDSIDNGQATGFMNLSPTVGYDNDQSCSGYLHLFNPASTTFVKHYISRVHGSHSGDFSIEHLTAGYFNTTSAIDAIQFKFFHGETGSSDTDAGDICLYGIK